DVDVLEVVLPGAGHNDAVEWQAITSAGVQGELESGTVDGSPQPGRSSWLSTLEHLFYAAIAGASTTTIRGAATPRGAPTAARAGRGRREGGRPRAAHRQRVR